MDNARNTPDGTGRSVRRRPPGEDPCALLGRPGTEHSLAQLAAPGPVRGDKPTRLSREDAVAVRSAVARVLREIGYTDLLDGAPLRALAAAREDGTPVPHREAVALGYFCSTFGRCDPVLSRAEVRFARALADG